MTLQDLNCIVRTILFPVSVIPIHTVSEAVSKLYMIDNSSSWAAVVVVIEYILLYEFLLVWTLPFVF